MYPIEKDTLAAAVSKTMKGKYQDQSYPLSYKDEFRACQALVISKGQLVSGNDFKSTLKFRQTHQTLPPRTVFSPVLSVSADPEKARLIPFESNAADQQVTATTVASQNDMFKDAASNSHKLDDKIVSASHTVLRKGNLTTKIDKRTYNAKSSTDYLKKILRIDIESPFIGNNTTRSNSYGLC